MCIKLKSNCEVKIKEFKCVIIDIKVNKYDESNLRSSVIRNY